MALDPQAQVLLDQLAALDGPPLETLTPPDARAAFVAFNRMLPKVEAARSLDYQVPVENGEITVRVHWPMGTEGSEGTEGTAGSEPLPVLVWLHGGGWTVGDLDTSDSTAAELANSAGCVVANVDYRLSPEHPYPGPLEDAHAAVQWVVDHADDLAVDPRRLAVGGDSAGGNLAAAVCLRARESGGPDIRFQLLVYPCIDGRRSYPSFRENGDGYLLTASTMTWFWENYIGAADPEDPMLSPLYAPDLSGLPDALVITAEFDPLRDEGEAYAERLRQAGVVAHGSRYDGQIHGFFALSSVFDAARKAVDEAARALRAAL
jgi:acetyl esterase